MADILVLCPQERDRQAVAREGLDTRHRVRFAGEDLDRLESFDPVAFLPGVRGDPGRRGRRPRRISRRSSPRSSPREGLPGPSPEALLACQHKPTSRRIQLSVARESTPRFAELGQHLPFEPPFFVKPVVGRLSSTRCAWTRWRISRPSPTWTAYADRYGAIAALAGARPDRARGFLAEELLEGLEVTLDGYVHAGRVTTIGVTDSVMYPGTISFERFEYPTRLARERQAELAELAERLVLAHGLDDTFFNIEFFVPEEGPARSSR